MMSTIESDESQAVTELYNMILCFIKPMSFKCALDLGIVDQICSHGQPMTLSQLHSSLSLPQSKEPHLRHLMRILAHYGLVQAQSGASAGSEPIYDLTPLSRILTNKEGSLNMVPFVRLQFELTKAIYFKAFLFMADWLKQEDKQTSFEMAHGCSLWEMARQNSGINDKFNSSMDSTCSIVDDLILKSGCEIFKGVESLVDVGGGIGAVAKLIATNFPHVDCTVLDLPHVVKDLPSDGIVKFIPGDMFNYIPPADALLLKSVLHDWGDEDCIKILEKCKEAINPTKGKVLILEVVVGCPPAKVSEETQLLMDMLLMAVHAGAERDENEWKSLFTRAGYSSYKIAHTVGLYSIIEVYP